MSDTARSNGRSVNKIFGESLPDTTKDEWDEPSSDGEADRERWLRDNVPPHHG